MVYMDYTKIRYNLWSEKNLVSNEIRALMTIESHIAFSQNWWSLSLGLAHYLEGFDC